FLFLFFFGSKNSKQLPTFSFFFSGLDLLFKGLFVVVWWSTEGGVVVLAVSFFFFFFLSFRSSYC
ncbi:hypothetical protein KSS87_011569, partial [Heliosperma pusillum]